MDSDTRLFFIINTLLKKPCTVKELQNLLMNKFEAEKKISVHAIYDDLEKIKKTGFKLEESKRTRSGIKYSIVGLPFFYELQPEERQLIKDIFDTYANNTFVLTGFFEKISGILNFDIQGILQSKENLPANKKNYLKIRKELESACLMKKKVRFIYKPPGKQEKSYEGFPYKIETDEKKTDRVVIYSPEGGIYLTFNLERIIDVPMVLYNEVFMGDFPPFHALFKLYAPASIAYHLLPGEKEIEKNENFHIIQCRYYNSFLLIQKLFKYGDKAEILSPPEARTEMKNKIENMRNLYT